MTMSWGGEICESTFFHTYKFFDDPQELEKSEESKDQRINKNKKAVTNDHFLS